MQASLFDNLPKHHTFKGQHGATWRTGNWQHRNHHGFLQSRENGHDVWMFTISGFQSEPEEHGLASVYAIDQNGELHQVSVPIDPNNRLTIHGRKYGRTHWMH